MNYQKFLQAMALAVAISLCENAAAQILKPDVDNIVEAMNSRMPAPWTVTDIEIQASVNDGDAINPKYRQRFVAEAEPSENLYSMVVRELVWAPYKVVIETHGAGEPFNLYGIATSTYSQGEWDHRFSFENTFEQRGQPLDMFSSPVVVGGTKQADEVISKLSEAETLIKTIAERAVRTEANISALKETQEQELEILRKENAKRLESIEKRYEAERAAIEASQETLSQIAESRAEMSALDELIAVQEELEEKRAHVRAREEALLAQKINEESKRLETVLALLESNNPEDRRAGFDTLFAFEDAEVNTMALKKALSTDYGDLKQHAITVAIGSENETFINLAFESWLRGLPEIIMEMYYNNNYKGTAYYEVLSVSEHDRITGNLKLEEMLWFVKSKKNFTPEQVNGSGIMHGLRLNLIGTYFDRSENTEGLCLLDLRLDAYDRRLEGTMECDPYFENSSYRVYVEIWGS